MAKKSKKKYSTSWVTKLLVLVSLALLGLILYQLTIKKQSHFKMFTEFGIDVPINYTIHGIDVSHHNDEINWTLVKQMNVSGIKIHFAFIKATQGINFVDSEFKANWQGTKKAGIVRGAYHYFTENASGVEQARHFINTVGDIYPGDMPPVLDIEENKSWSLQKLNDEALAFVQTLEAHYKIKPIIYTFVNYYNEKIDKRFSAYPFWAAHYNEKQAPNSNRNWIIWQHNEHGNVSGINEDVDFNVFNGDIYKFQQLLK